MKKRVGCLLVSGLLGLGMAAAFFRVCQGRDCVITKGPSVDYVTSNVWRDGEECYRYRVKAVDCPDASTAEVDSGRVAVGL